MAFHTQIQLNFSLVYDLSGDLDTYHEISNITDIRSHLFLNINKQQVSFFYWGCLLVIWFSDLNNWRITK